MCGHRVPDRSQGSWSPFLVPWPQVSLAGGRQVVPLEPDAEGDGEGLLAKTLGLRSLSSHLPTFLSKA